MSLKDIWQPRQQLKFLESAQPLLEHGQMKEKLNIIESGNEPNVGIMLKNSLIDVLQMKKTEKMTKRNIESDSSMQESQPEIRRMTCNDKYLTSEQDTLIMSLLQILDQDLTSKEKVLKPFWTTQSKEVSKNLWLPIKTGCVDLDSSCSNTLFPPTLKGKSWFSTTLKVPQNKKSAKTSSAFLQFLEQELTDFESINHKLKKNGKIKKQKNLKTIKIRLLPTTKQKRKLRDWFGLSRWYYNRTIDLARQIVNENNNRGIPLVSTIINRKGEERTVSKFGFQSMRNEMRRTSFEHKRVNGTSITFIETLNPNNKKFTIPDWCKSDVCPRIIASTIKDFTDALSTQKKLVKEGIRSHFTMSYRTKKHDQQSIGIEKTCFGYDNRFLPSYFDKLKIAPIWLNNKRVSFKSLNISTDCRLTYDKVNDSYYFNIPIEVTENSDIQGKKPVIALDPGIRTFQTGFSLDEVVEFGMNTGKDIFYYQKQINSLYSSYSKASSKRKKRILLRVIRRKYLRIRNMITDLHWKTISFIVKRYNNVIIPEFRTQQIQKGLPKSQKFLLSTLSHFRFRERLKWKCSLNNVKFCLTTEEYTSKTCTVYGTLNNVGSSKHYSCSKCGTEIDRDYNGARNILIKTLSSK